jgi:hypothetical protein
MTHALRAAFPGKALIQTNNGMFDVEGYAEAGQCTITTLASPPQMQSYWTVTDLLSLQTQGTAEQKASPTMEARAVETSDRIVTAWTQIEWQSATLVVEMTSWNDGHAPPHYWLLTETEVVARAFLAAVCRWMMELRDEVLVFENGN